jgi:transposase
MARPVTVRPLNQGEDRELLRVVRGVGGQDAVRLRRALIVRASADGVGAPLIARVLGADADHVRDVIHAFNTNGLPALDPHWGPGPPRRATPAQEAYILKVAQTRPGRLGQPFTHWSLRKLAGYLADNPAAAARLGREQLRQLLRAHRISFPTDPHLEDLHRPGVRRQAGPDRGGPVPAP